MSFKQFVLLKDIKIFLLLGFMFPSTLLSGCFPIFKTKHPKINITVINDQNEKLDDAEVFLNLTTWQGKSFTESTLKKTQDGIATFSAEKSLQFIHIFPAKYSWSICVYKNGYSQNSFVPKSSNNRTQNLVLLLDKAEIGVEKKQHCWKEKS
ncbi:hypothetical protein [Acinetobacter sp. YH12126]|uniref:hypothetical protein n=1 Tax=Acinetobacter sp. YH12126 TaxID=2601111 RepID=UPI0015D1F854|nr:hypothetical protein [Acinetobacter sp. YH12126]